MPTITITVGAEFAQAVQDEAALVGQTPVQFAKSAVRDGIIARRLARVSEAADATKATTIQTAVRAAESQANVTIDAEAALLNGLN